MSCSAHAAGLGGEGGQAAASGGAEFRLSDAERLDVIERLQQAAGEGRLTLDEFSDRVDRVFAAQTASALAPLLVDLPVPVLAPAPLPLPPPRRRSRRRRRRVVAVLGASDRKGRWHLHRRTTAFALMGGVTLDLRGAAIDDPVVDIRCWAIMGGVDVIVPEGVPVDFAGFVLMGGRDEKIAAVPERPDAPTLRVRGYGLWGAVDVTSKPQPVDERPLVEEVRLRLRHTLDRVLPASGRPGPARPSGTPTTVTVLVAALAPAPAGPSGRRRTWRRLEEANRRLVADLLRHGAGEVHGRDAGVVAVFPSARAALRAAAAVRAQAELSPGLELRLGAHAAELEDLGAELGRVTEVARALAGSAAAGEVLVSALVADLAGGGDAGTGGLRLGLPRTIPAARGPAQARPLLRT
jgi:hypothetical protein